MLAAFVEILDVTLKRINHGYNIEVNEKATLHKQSKGARLGMPFAMNLSGWAIRKKIHSPEASEVRRKSHEIDTRGHKCFEHGLI